MAIVRFNALCAAAAAAMMIVVSPALCRGMAQDDAAALSWYRKAADQGDPAGQYNLGLMYAEGRGDMGGEGCKTCPSWRSPASSDMPPVVGSANFPEDVPRLRVCHLVKQRIGTHKGHAVHRTLQACG